MLCVVVRLLQAVAEEEGQSTSIVKQIYCFKEEAMKKENKKRLVKVFIALVLILAITATSAVLFAAQGNQKNPKILPPNSKPLGLSYAEWSVKWWQWAYSIPLPDNPLFQDEKCDVGEQPRHVRFLAGKFCLTTDTEEEGCYGDYTEVTRYCTIPPGTHLFFPVANAEADNIGMVPPLSPTELRDYAKSQYESTLSMAAEVDGVTVNGLSDPLTSPYRVKSDFFNYVVPADNIFQVWGLDVPQGTIVPAIADGAFLMLAPLPVGEHKVRFSAEFVGGFSFLITYIITVTP
jgi:hypothetical protein